MQIEYQNHLESRQGEVPVRELLEQAFGSEELGSRKVYKPRELNQKVHTMMVSYFNNNVPYFTYHSSNRYRRSLNQALLDWQGATFYAYRT